MDADLKEVQSLLHRSALRPEGPAAPLVCNAADLIIQKIKQNRMYIRQVVIDNHIRMCRLTRGMIVSKNIPHLSFCITNFNGVVQMKDSSFTLLREEMKASFCFPFEHQIAGKNCALLLDEDDLGMPCCIVLPSLMS